MFNDPSKYVALVPNSLKQSEEINKHHMHAASFTQPNASAVILESRFFIWQKSKHKDLML